MVPIMLQMPKVVEAKMTGNTLVVERNTPWKATPTPNFAM